jgi:hypothetical protein
MLKEYKKTIETIKTDLRIKIKENLHILKKIGYVKQDIYQFKNGLRPNTVEKMIQLCEEIENEKND